MKQIVDGYVVWDTKENKLWEAPSAKNKRGKKLWNTRAAAGNAWTCHNTYHKHNPCGRDTKFTEQNRFVTKGVLFTIVDLDKPAFRTCEDCQTINICTQEQCCDLTFNGYNGYR